jgi:hypothetical protein
MTVLARGFGSLGVQTFLVQCSLQPAVFIIDQSACQWGAGGLNMSPVWAAAGRSFITNALYHGHGCAEFFHHQGFREGSVTTNFEKRFKSSGVFVCGWRGHVPLAT